MFKYKYLQELDPLIPNHDHQFEILKHVLVSTLNFVENVAKRKRKSSERRMCISINYYQTAWPIQLRM
jgi:hypothetical protein